MFGPVLFNALAPLKYFTSNDKINNKEFRQKLTTIFVRGQLFSAILSAQRYTADIRVETRQSDFAAWQRLSRCCKTDKNLLENA